MAWLIMNRSRFSDSNDSVRLVNKSESDQTINRRSLIVVIYFVNLLVVAFMFDLIIIIACYNKQKVKSDGKSVKKGLKY